MPANLPSSSAVAGVVRSPGLESWIACFGNPQYSGFEIGHIEVPVHASYGTAKNLRILCKSEQSVPDFASDACTSIIFDGRLFNSDDLVHQFNVVPGASAGEILLAGYRLIGERVFQKAKGVYLIIIRDDAKDLLLCGRDRVGVYPLFYSDTTSEFVISPSIQSILEYPSVSKNIDRVVVCEYLCNRWPNAEETHFEKISRVPPAHVLLRKNSAKQLWFYWNPLPDSLRGEWIDDELSQFDSVFESAVQRYMSVGSSSVSLSGGLDSVSVACLASDLAGRNEWERPFALSLLYPDPGCDEGKIQRSVAEALGLEQFALPFEHVYGAQGLLSVAVEVCKSWPVPIMTPWKPGFLALAREAHNRNHPVILSGHGGDEWLTVNPVHAADLIRYGNVPDLIPLARNFIRSYSLPALSQLRYILWTSGVKQLLRAYGPVFAPARMRAHRTSRIRSLTPSWLAPDPDLRRAVDHRIDEIVDTSIRKPIPKGKFGFYFDNFVDIYVRSLASIEMEEDFETGRRTGTFLLKPFFDPDVIELLLRIKPQTLQKGGREKGLVRLAVAQRFPGLQFEKQRKVVSLGFLKSMLLQEGPRVWKHLNGVPTLAKLGIVDRASMTEVFDRSAAGNLEENYRIWKLLSLEAWALSRS